MGIGSARGEDRAVKAAELAIASPLLEASIDGAHGVLLSIQGGSDLGLFEINEAARLVQEVAHPEANIIFGAVIDDALGDEARVTVIAAGFDDVKATSPSMDQSQPQVAPQRPAAPAAAPASAHQQGGNHQGGNHQQNTQPVHAGVGAAGLSNWGQQRPTAVPADSGFDVDLPSVVEPDLTGTHPDDLDVPDFLK
jgi:cell division protein FtsZ